MVACFVIDPPVRDVLAYRADCLSLDWVLSPDTNNSLMYSQLMKGRKPRELEPLPRSVLWIIGALATILAGSVLLGGKFYLANWRGDAVFLPVAILIGLLLIAAAITRFFRKG
jgi:hypothetical protein